MNLVDAAIIIEAQAKLIKQQSIEITALEQKLEQKEYNRRFTNTKHRKVPISPPFNTALLDPKRFKEAMKK